MSHNIIIVRISATCYFREFVEVREINGTVRDNFRFLTDRTNGRAIDTVLRLSSVTLCIVPKRCVLEQKLLLAAYEVVYEKSIGTKRNDLDLCYLNTT